MKRIPKDLADKMVEDVLIAISKLDDIPSGFAKDSLDILDNPTDNLVFTAVGSWKSPKQPHLFIESLNNIQKRKSQKIVLNIIGEGPLLTHFKDHQELYSIQINFLGIRNKNERIKKSYRYIYN